MCAAMSADGTQIRISVNGQFLFGGSADRPGAGSTIEAALRGRLAMN
jgi:hypothetical protein